MKSVWKIEYSLRDKGEALSTINFNSADHCVRVVAQTADQAIA